MPASDALLVQGLRDLALPLGEAPVQQLLLYTAELARWTQRVNLTGFKGPEQIVREGILRSLRLLHLLPERAGLTLADVGSGAGFPGIPLKVARPTLRVTLIEASRRKTTFLMHIIHLLGLGEVSCQRARAETLGKAPPFRGAFEVVTARGLAPLPKAIPILAPLLSPGGSLLLPQGRGEQAVPAALPQEGYTLDFEHLPATSLLPAETVAILRRSDVSRET